MNTQSESPFGNPRFILSIVVVFVFLWAWQFYVNKKYPPVTVKSTPVAQQNNTVDSAAAVPETKSASTEAVIEATKHQSLDSIPLEVFNYEDEKLKWQLSSDGMGLKFVELKTFQDKQKKPVQFLQETHSLFGVMVHGQTVRFKVTKVSDTEYSGETLVDGKTIKRTVKFNQQTRAFESETQFEQAPSSLSFVTEEPKAKVSGGNIFMPSFEKQDFLYKDAEKVNTHYISSVKDGDTLEESAKNVTLATVGTQYFTQAYVDKSEVIPNIKMSVKSGWATMSVNYDLANSQIKSIKNIYYIGAKETEVLEKIDPLMPEVMDYGMFGFISRPLLKLMKFMFGIFGNWGLAIIALTLVMRVLMLPFNVVSFKSAKAMQRIQPQLQAVREKYKNDPMQVNRETMALMKEHKANPLSSCLPMLVQIPIFFALWRTIGSSIEIYQQPFFGWITDLSAYDHFFILPVLMGATMYFQQKLTPTTMDPTQAKIMNFMPILFSVFMLSLPSGLTLYNFISSLFGAVQQYFLTREAKA